MIIKGLLSEVQNLRMPCLPTVSKLGKEHVKAVNCHPVYLTYMQSTSCKMPNRMSYKQRHYFANNGPYSQSYSLFSSHVWL